MFELDSAVIAELAAEIDSEHRKLRVQYRLSRPARGGGRSSSLIRLLHRPESVPVMHAAYVRKLQYWLLRGRHGSAIRGIGLLDGHEGVARAIATLREQFTTSLPIGSLAEVAGMSVSSFHQHFREVTSLTPLRFLKQLRLIKAKQRMLADGLNAS